MIQKLKEQICEYYIGNPEAAEDLLICLLSKGHVLIEDVPGVGKTTLARTLAGSTDCDFGRIQFTPDTLPGDVTGTYIYNMKTGEFVFREGAVMHQIILADEINRTSPKTQASLLEAMEERQVTVDGKTYPLPEPFMVIATQNPVEFLGTYPLPEAQMDRFLMRISLGYPARDDEITLAKNFLSGKTVSGIKSICTAQDVIKMQEDVDKIHVSDGVLGYIRQISELTRSDGRFVCGASPRATLAMLKASMAKAYMSGQDFVRPDDVKAVAVKVLHHRLSLTSASRIHGQETDHVLRELILKAKVPME